MMKPAAWTARNFSFDRPVETFSEVLERLRGTPTRAAELVHGYSDETLGRRPTGEIVGQRASGPPYRSHGTG